MKVLIVGGTGLIGSEAAKCLIARGHNVMSLSLPPLPEGAEFPPGMKIEFGNHLQMSDDELRRLFDGCEGFIFATGVDERVPGPPPIYDMYKKYNIDAVTRLMRIAKECGVRHAAVCGSYFTYFDRLWPQYHLAEVHPYIRSRRDQETVALSFADDTLDIAVLEFPYIFGVQKGRRPVWVFLVNYIRKSGHLVLWTRGGTTMITARQAGEALAGALERNRGGHCYPIGYDNLTWKEMVSIISRHLGMPRKKVLTMPDGLFRIVSELIYAREKKEGIENGLNPRQYGRLQCADLYIDKSLGYDPLGVTPDNIDAAIGESVALCVEILDHQTKTLRMRGE